MGSSSDYLMIEEIDELRSRHDLENRWMLKRKFLYAHHESYPRARLICLAETYCNIVLTGCK
jgi:hypothetical protein